MQPAKIQSLLQAALAHHRAGRLAEAELLYRQVRVAAPRNFDVLHLSGLAAYQQGRMAEAVDLLGRAHKADPRHAVCEMRYALALIAAQRPDEAEKHLRHVVATKPELHEAWDNLAYCLKTQNRLTEAIACNEKCVAAQPGYARGWFNYGLTLSLAGRVHEALTCHERALAADPSYAMARFGRAQALQQAHRIPEAVADYTTFLAAKPQHHDARSYRLLALHYLENISREELFAEHLAYGRAVGAAPAREFPNSPEPGRRLRLAILSPDLRTHACAFFLEPMLQHLDRRAFEIFLYHDHISEDVVSARLKKQAACWRNFVALSAHDIERTIRADAPDILIDLSAHTGMTGRLPVLARRLAPVQATYLGYPDTTGVDAVDYRFTDAIADPEGEADRFAVEKLVRFASTAWSYLPAEDTPAVAPVLPAARGHVVFGCFNNLAKVTDRMLAVWAAILRAVPDARLQLKGRGLADAPVRARYLERFARAGLPAERVELIERTASAAEHLALYQGVDVALDTFPYHGTTTTCEALWMGVPVVTLRGDRHASRVGASLLRAVGHPEWIAEEEADYVRLAIALARAGVRDEAARANLREELRRSPLHDHAGQAARFGAALRECWRNWCGMQCAAAPAAPGRSDGQALATLSS